MAGGQRFIKNWFFLGSSNGKELFFPPNLLQPKLTHICFQTFLFPSYEIKQLNFKPVPLSICSVLAEHSQNTGHTDEGEVWRGRQSVAQEEGQTRRGQAGVQSTSTGRHWL